MVPIKPQLRASALPFCARLIFFYRELIAIGSFVHSVELNMIPESSILVTVCSLAKWHCSSCCPNLWLIFGIRNVYFLQTLLLNVVSRGWRTKIWIDAVKCLLGTTKYRSLQGSFAPSLENFIFPGNTCNADFGCNWNAFMYDKWLYLTCGSCRRCVAWMNVTKVSGKITTLNTKTEHWL